MTDEHDPDSQPMHEETPDHEQTPQAPVDDFADSESASEETATISQESASDEDAVSSKPERSRSKAPVFVGLLGLVAIGGGLAYWQFGNSPGVSSAAIEQAMNTKPVNAQNIKIDAKPAGSEAPAQPADNHVETVANSTPSPSSTAPTASSSDIGSLYKPAAEPSTDAVHVAETPPPVAISSNAPPAVPPPSVVPTAPAQVAPAVEAAAVSPSPSAAPASQPMAPAPIPPAATGISAAGGPHEPVSSRLDALSARLNDLEKSLDQTTKQLTDLAATQSATANSGPGNNDIEQRLDKIEHDLNQLKSEDLSVKTGKKPLPLRAENQPTATPSKAEAVRKAKIHKVLAKKHIKPSPAKSETKPEKSTVSSAWVLRAATPTEAWVSTNATSADLRHVQVGDSLPGVGKVKEIVQSPNGWEIIGSDARVH